MQPSPVLLFTCFVSWYLFVYVFNCLTQPNICSFVYSIVWPSPLLILFKPRAQWNFLIKNGFVQQTSLPKAGIKDLVSKLPLLFFQAKTIEITYCKLEQMPNGQYDRHLTWKVISTIRIHRVYMGFKTIQNCLLRVSFQVCLIFTLLSQTILNIISKKGNL